MRRRKKSNENIHHREKVARAYDEHEYQASHYERELGKAAILPASTATARAHHRILDATGRTLNYW